MKSLLILLTCLSAAAQPWFAAMDTTGYPVNGCNSVHCWSYTNGWYQVPIVQGSAIRGLCKEFSFIAQETTNDPPVSPTVHLIGHRDFNAIRTMGVMPWQVAPDFHRVATVSSGLMVERLTNVTNDCEKTNFLRLTVPLERTVEPNTWWVVFFPDECKHRWQIPPLLSPEGTNAPGAWLAARYFTGTGWRYYFDTLWRQSRNQTIAYTISYYRPVIPPDDVSVGPISIQPARSNTVKLSWPQLNATNIWLWSSMGWSALPDGNSVYVDSMNEAEVFWLERRSK